MRDHQDARLWADHHQDVSNWVDRLMSDVMQAFRVLNRIEWSAPWHADCKR